MIIDDVTFSYRRHHEVLHGVNIEFMPGRTALLGPNGAGKSTLFSLSSGATVPQSGKIKLGTAEASSRALRRRVGLMSQTVRPIAGLTVREQVTYCGWLMGLGTREAATKAEKVIADVDLSEKADERSSRISGGQLRRVGLAQVIVGQPEVLLLDEPTAGLDPAQRMRFRDVLERIPNDRVTVVSTHQVDDLADGYDRVVVLSSGRVVFDGTPHEFLDLAPEDAPHRAETAYLGLVADE
ncbi:ATP-binding cassette domain-containing protein [uncultured Cutibacterium sp.]|uniref:ATP-binding cassette domain-containing protein n=1 Tax=uncultured Cutibacterium sp. TaxID=1912223 RepID=UPI00259A4F52|nr:ATP-binding cassette domain-containing protein [uncultured Cutibacterium sp.]